MTFLKRGSTGDDVKTLQNTLRELDYDIPVTAVFDTATQNAVKHFQSSHLDKHNNPLVVDGEVGDLTWWALQNPRNNVSGMDIDFSVFPDISLGGSPVGRKALEFAINELRAGAGEIGGNNKGPFVKKYLQPAGLGEGKSWCAAFISWCFLQAADGNKAAMPFKYTAGARNILNQFKQKGLTLNDTTTLLPGDIVGWWRVSMPSGLGHILFYTYPEDIFRGIGEDQA